MTKMFVQLAFSLLLFLDRFMGLYKTCLKPNAMNRSNKISGDRFLKVLGVDEGVEHFGPQIRILRQKLPMWSISEVYDRPSRSKYEETYF